MSKLDLRKQLAYASNSREVIFLELPVLAYAMIDGRGDPNHAPEYAAAVEALFALAYGLKFRIKQTLGIDYGVLPLEGLWWADDLLAFETNDRSQWQWTMLIMQPEWVTAELFEEQRVAVQQKKGLAALERVRYARLDEGYVAQITHRGPFSTEGPTIAGLHAAIAAAGHRPRLKHHEIYLSDIRRAAPEKWRTIIRQPC